MYANNLSFAKKEFNQPVVTNTYKIFVSIINTVSFNIKNPRVIQHLGSKLFFPLQ